MLSRCFGWLFDKRRTQGYSLIEVLIVLTILGLVSVSLPTAWSRYQQNAEYRNVLRVLMSELRGARLRAILEGQPVSVFFDLEKGVMQVESQVKLRLVESSELKIIVVTAEELSEGTNKGAITFMPDGGATGGEVRIIRSSGDGVSINVNWLHGKIWQKKID